ncbi:uroporphyrinogen decarboxylase [Methylobacter tundripaludum]|uniref:Uroporphyrinogen decarboxylase n=2 Tax=Methylobacter tundripaludum TaxID=173365 RepID=A0A2S6GZM0_9GAMM|nr:uroporphyrinogen decarboxylase [Methylobacter tundripaludum]
MMTGMDRLVAAIKGEKADRIPVFCNLLDQGAKELGLVSLYDYYQSGEYVAEGQLKMREKYGYDNVWSLFYVGKEAELLGCRKILFSPDGPPNVEHFVIQSYDDIHRLEIPDDITHHPVFVEELKCLQILKREVGGRYPICGYVTAAMALPALLMGMDKWFELLFMGPPEVRDELLAKCSLFCQRHIAALRELGVDVIVYANPFGSTDFVPLPYIIKTGIPWMKQDLSAGTQGIVYYCGGARFNQVIEAIISQIGIETYYLSPLDDIAAGKQIINGRGLTCGVINDIKLIDWSEEQIRQEVKRMLEAGMAGGKFLFGTILMPYKIPERNIRAMLDTVYEFGQC